MTKTIKMKASGVKDWVRIDADYSIGEFHAKLQGWDVERRFIVIRERIRESRPAVGRRLFDIPGYTFRVMVTSMSGEPSEIWRDYNIDTASRITSEFEQTSLLVGRQGKINARLPVTGLDGSWVRLVGSGNSLIEDLVSPMNEMVRVIAAISNGDLSQTVPTEVGGKKLEGEFKKSAEVVNAVVEKLGTFSSEVTRVAREVGTDGKLGGQAAVPGVTGTWKDLTESVNFMAANLTNQVRNIAEVTTAVATGELSKKITVDAKGEILELKSTINTMLDQLRSFAAVSFPWKIAFQG